jgi:hypothetical protein
MAEATGAGGLAWVQEPAISEGKVVYKYKNSSDADADFVGESVSSHAADGTPSAQMFQVQGLAAGAEQETHAPLPADLVDGPITINLQITASKGDAYTGELLYELKGQIAGGTLHPAGEVSAATTLAVEAVDVKLDGTDLVIHYRITGDGHLDAISLFVSILDPQGGQGWMESFVPEIDREDIFRTAVPFDEFMNSDTGWEISTFILAADTKADVKGTIEVRLPVERVDGKVVAAGGWSSLAES